MSHHNSVLIPIAAQKSKLKVKGLKRALSLMRHFEKSVKHVSAWNNNPVSTTKTLKLACLFLVGIHNIKTEEFPGKDLEVFTSQSSKLYIRILMTLYIEGSAAKTRILTATGIGENKMYLINELVLKRYVKEVYKDRIRYTYLDKPKRVPQREIELTDKGYKFLNDLFKILVSEELF